jgi:DMSO/TMAO reductase YedYZ molybdopterin-dependent catalytic subunit
MTKNPDRRGPQVCAPAADFGGSPSKAMGLGVVSAAAGLAAAELVASLTRPEASPLVGIGGAIIDATPTAVKEFAVHTVGTRDKPLLLTGIVLAVIALAAVAGVLVARRRAVGLALMGLLGVLGMAAALSRPAARPIDLLAPAVGGAVAVACLGALTRPVPASAGRRVVVATGAVALAALLTGTLTALLRQRATRDAAAAREAVNLPEPAAPAPDQPAPRDGFFTPNRDFYRVDTALTVPRIDVDSWRLTIKGAVDRPLTLTFADLLAMPLTERDITLNCVSNEVGGPYIGNATWLGVPLADLLRKAGIRAGADQILARSVDGMTIGTPVSTVLDGRDAMLAVGMNGEPLPLDHGFPMRMLTPGLYGYAGACKWITSIELTTFADVDAYWVKRGWAARAPVKISSRIDRPAPFSRPSAGDVTVAGVAWAQTRGISTVEISVDDGPWARAELLPVATADTWVQWRYTWHAVAGAHTLRCRAADRRGDVQTGDRATPFPDGATGWHTIAVTAS